MPSIYTIEGTSKPKRAKRARKRSRTKSAKRTAHQKKFAAASKYCSRRSRESGIDFRQCMAKELG